MRKNHGISRKMGPMKKKEMEIMSNLGKNNTQTKTIKSKTINNTEFDKQNMQALIMVPIHIHKKIETFTKEDRSGKKEFRIHMINVIKVK